ncbi:hypothetical protein LTR78_003294 [Recurvomyces mirabilis]|uniref:Arylamine N-acetyltransferase n=1 Tax=Recurvomyces mirabilis TaxID=574656 RepID=A0AAE1C425_9PEZI|nr:hypothetical protein LTR78_003294 [Recurvomyces mirabilis]KAK5156889.1 hypothetical protein LTS14_004406 [Recurvomyces mirabilis]
MALSSRPEYTPQQLHEVYERVKLPSRYRYEPGEFSREVVRHRDGHGFLGALVSHTLAHVPFENLALHYSPHHQVSIHPGELFQKIVTQRTGRGGYRLENNVFLGTVLRSIGFEVMSVGARVNAEVKNTEDETGRCRFGGWSHLVNLVTIRGETFVVDVGFGSGGPTRPIALKEGATELSFPPPPHVRLRRDAIPENEHRGNKLWIMERRSADDRPWTALYCFEDNVCFLPQDFEVMNFFTSTHRTSFFTYRVLCSKYILDDEEERVIGEIVLYENKVTRKIGGERELLATFATESERMAALEKYLGVTLDAAQATGIRGMVTELGTPDRNLGPNV